MDDTKTASSSTFGAQRARAIYDVGHSTIFASRSDPRFSYCTYVPPHLDPASTPQLVVVMHGTGRAFTEYRNAFASFARWNNCIILCPLFPVGVNGDGNRDGFKQIREADIHYDNILQDMVAEVGEKFGYEFTKFALFGYSGGGQFANRFYLLHPEKLWAVSIGAPGSVTLLDQTQDWWVGVRDMEQRFGIALDLEQLRSVPVHMIVGKADIETWEITHTEGSKFYMEGANSAGKNRPERLHSLQKSFEASGIDVTFDFLDNVPHNGLACVEPVQTFFAAALQKVRQHDAITD